MKPTTITRVEQVGHEMPEAAFEYCHVCRGYHAYGEVAWISGLDGSEGGAPLTWSSPKRASHELAIAKAEGR